MSESECIFENALDDPNGDPWCLTHSRPAFECLQKVTKELEYIKKMSTAVGQFAIDALGSWVRLAEQCGIKGDQKPFQAVVRKFEKYDSICNALAEIESFCKENIRSAEPKEYVCNHIIELIEKAQRD